MARILIAEDEPDIRAVAEFALEDEGFELHSCTSGQEALSRSTTFQPDLILLDVMMPGLDGPTTLAKLRELPNTAHTPVIFMTAKAQPAEVAGFRALGAIGVITKPFDALGLAGEIHGLLRAANHGA